MSDTDGWLERYRKNHDSVGNPFAYWIAVPMLVLGTVGVLWWLPIPQQFAEISPLLNWGSAFLMVTAVYYFIISLSLAIGLLPFLLAIAALQMWLLNSGLPAMGVTTGLLVAGAAGLLLVRSGRIGAVVQDIQLMMIGPAWLLASLYRRFGLPV